MALQHLRSSTANKRPLPGSMSDGQIAINTNTSSPGLFFKDSAGALIKVGPVHVGSTAPNASPAGGGETGNTVGEQWLDTSGGTYVFKVWDGSAWRSETGTFVDVNGDVMTGALGIIAGSAGSPGLYFSGDTNTGLYSPGADQVAISTNGAARLTITSDGDIRTTWGNDRFLGSYFSSSYYQGLLFDGGNSKNLKIVNRSGDTSADIVFLNAINGTPTEKLRITAAGLVGVGTSSPSAALDVTGNSKTSTLQIGTNPAGVSIGVLGIPNQKRIYGRNAANSADVNILYIDGSNGMVFGPNDAAVIDSSGRLGIGTSSPQDTLQIGADSTSHIAIANGGSADVTSGIKWRFGSGGTVLSQILSAATGVGSNTYLTFHTSGTGERVRIDALGRVGIGSTSPDVNLVVEAATGDATLRVHAAENNSGSEPILILESSNDFAESIIEFKDSSGTGGAIRYNHGDNAIRFQTNGSSERARIDSSGRLLVGTTSASSTATTLLLQGSADGASGPSYLRLATGTSSPGSTSTIGQISFTDSGHTTAASIIAFRDGGTWTSGSSQPTRLTFSTTSDSASSPTERARITSSGFFKAKADTVYQSETGTYHEFSSNTSSTTVLNVLNKNASYIGPLLNGGADRSANSAYDFQTWYSAYSGTFDLEFRLRGDGNGLCDGAWTGGGADYAEYFEWSDSNPDAEDRRGISVVLDGDKIREAQAGEDPIGVISGNPSVVGDAAWNKWSGKYLRDEFGTYLLDENGDRQLNPAHDPDQKYIPREQRPEWDCVGLMGKLRIRKGQATGSRWIKMRDISDSVEEWLVR